LARTLPLAMSLLVSDWFLTSCPVSELFCTSSLLIVAAA
jgi:hypothetical protein